MLDPLKQALIEEVDRLSPELLQISRFLHANPELAFEEYQAAEFLTRTLEEHGFSLERSVEGFRRPLPRPTPRVRDPPSPSSPSTTPFRALGTPAVTISLRQPRWGLPWP